MQVRVEVTKEYGRFNMVAIQERSYVNSTKWAARAHACSLLLRFDAALTK